MAKLARQWTALDKAAISMLTRARDTDPRSLSYRQMAKIVGMTPSRLSGMFLQTMAPPTLDEFVDLCLLFGLRPSTALDKAMQEAAESASPAGERRPVLSVSPADTVPSADDDAPLSNEEIMAMAANKDPNRGLEAETPRD
ncbi:hypothetical protein [Bifidobacterium porcinum]|uniref:hypothetical protein n=1 Tax=Bifidobacterium porcinum TaxID=212365 RepID=UPI003994706C